MGAFQSTPPHRWRPQRPRYQPRWWFFQSTPPHRWRPPSGRRMNSEERFQSTPPHRWRRQFNIWKFPVKILSIHSTTQVETAISYNIIQDFLLISNKLTIISYIYHQFLLHILSITIPFCIFFWCESPWNFMFAWHSHQISIARQRRR